MNATVVRPRKRPITIAAMTVVAAVVAATFRALLLFGVFDDNRRDAPRSTVLAVQGRVLSGADQARATNLRPSRPETRSSSSATSCPESPGLVTDGPRPAAGRRNGPAGGDSVPVASPCARRHPSRICRYQERPLRFPRPRPSWHPTNRRWT